MNRDPGKQRQVFQRQPAGDGHFEAHIRQTLNRADIRLTPRHACRLRVAAAVIDHLLNTRLAPRLRLLPGPEAGQLNLHIAVELFGDIQRPFGGVDIGAADHCDPVGVGFEAHPRQDLAGIGNFGVRQHDFMRIQRFQIAHRAYTFTDAEDSADFNDIYLFGDQTGCFISAGQRLVVQGDL